MTAEPPVDCDYAVVGAGIVGLATALALTERCTGARVLVLEKESGIARHQSGHNSGVIHAGVYYEPGSLKARLCREGNEATRRFCGQHGVPFEVCGKLIVATSALEARRLAALRDRCRANQLTVEELSGERLRALEPHIRGVAALRIAETGIVDYRQVCAALRAELERRGVELHFGFEVCSIRESAGEVAIAASSREMLRAAHLIACAGLQSDRLARLAGLDPKVRIVPFRGEYFRLGAAKPHLISHLIYPVPDPGLPFLGVHLTRTIDGGIVVGPNAVLALARERYEGRGIDLRDVADTLAYPGLWRMLATHWRFAIAELAASLSKSRYLEQCRKYCPELSLDDLEPHSVGIRAQAVLPDGTLVHDFLFAESERMVHVLSAPSPAATAAMPIGRMVADRIVRRVAA
ncbi:MAG TPA: L-2-hydroxyglutarate oxidase [Steroidobacteraceae bacterium]|nr:L-2-hydroxyglutarate oxidase [Steroidobacteraceae bacterium]